MKFYSFSFGCRVNEAEKEALDQKLLEKGFVYDEKNPQIYIINSCAVTEKATREARQLIYKLKRQNPQLKIVLTGCAATYWLKNKLYQNLPVEIIADNLQKNFLADLIEKRIKRKNHQQVLNLKNIPTSKFLSSGRVMIKIQDGCQRFCSFCIVPYLRGLPKSKTINQIIKEIKNYQNQIAEVILTAINTEAFGFDTKEKFTDLIKAVLKKTSVPRLSFGSIHPWSLNEDFFNFYQKYYDSQRLVHFFHIPLQSGTNKILSLMKRGYQRQEIEEKIFAIYKLNPFALLATDIIVGFLEETEKDFEETYRFLEKTPIVKFHVFRFSKRKNTAAYFMAKKLKEPTDEEKEKRSEALRLLSQKKFFQFQQKNLHRVGLALVLNKKTKGLTTALFENQLPILLQEDKNLTAGKIIPVKISLLKNHQLFAKIY